MNTFPSSGTGLLLRALRRRLRLLLPGVASLSLWQVCEALVPVAIGVVVDVAIIPRSLPLLVASVAGIALLFTVLSYGYRFGARLCNAAREEEAHHLRVAVSRAALTAPGLPPARASGEVLSIATADADLAAEVFGQVGRGAAAVLGLLVAAVVLIVADPVTGLIVLLAVPVGLVVVALPGRAVSATAAAQLAAAARAAQSASDLMRGLRVLTALGGADWARRRFRDASDAAAEAGVATAERSGRLGGLGALVMAVVLAVVLVAAGLRLLDGQLSVGALIAVLGMAAFLTEPMRALASLVGEAARSHGAAVRITALLADIDAEDGVAEDSQVEGNGAGQSAQQGSELTTPVTAPAAQTASADQSGGQLAGQPGRPDMVAVRLQDGALVLTAPALLGDAALEAPAGAFVCLVVEDDRTAERLLAALTARARRESSPAGSGEVGAHASRALLVAPHDVDLFEGTIRSNITMAGESAATAGDVTAEVLAASGVDELVGLVADGLDHRIHELGGNLSGGQRQRIALARALHGDARILVLEEPTTAVDAVTEARIAAGVARLRRGRTTVVVTASPAFLAVADAAVLVRASGAVETGTHADLLAATGPTGDAYRRAVLR